MSVEQTPWTVTAHGQVIDHVGVPVAMVDTPARAADMVAALNAQHAGGFLAADQYQQRLADVRAEFDQQLAAADRRTARAAGLNDQAARYAAMCAALRLIDRHGCITYTRGRCWDSGRTRGARYGADAWCDACVAADALGDAWCDTGHTPFPEPARSWESARDLTTAPEPPDGYQPGCSNRRCQCQRPGAVCNEFMGQDDTRYCPRCGWARDRHNSPQPGQEQDGDR